MTQGAHAVTTTHPYRAAFGDTPGWTRVEQSRFEDMLVFGSTARSGRAVVATLAVMDLERWSVHRHEPQTGTLVAREPWVHGGDATGGPSWQGLLTTWSIVGTPGDHVLRSWSFQTDHAVLRIDCACPVELFPTLTPSLDALVSGLHWVDGGPTPTPPAEPPTADRSPAYRLPNATELSRATADALLAVGGQGTGRRYLESSTASELVGTGLFRADGQPTAAAETFIDASGDPEYGVEVASHSGGLVRTLSLGFRGPWVSAAHHDEGGGRSCVALLHRTQAPDVLTRWSGLGPVRIQQATPLDIETDAFRRRMATAEQTLPEAYRDQPLAAVWNQPWRILRTRWTGGTNPAGRTGAHPFSALLMAGEAGTFRFGTVGRLAATVRLGPVPSSELFRRWVLDCGGFRAPEGLFTAP